MQLSGRFILDKEYLWVMSVTLKNNRIVVLDPSKQPDEPMYPENINIFKLDKFADSIIAGVITSPKGDITWTLRNYQIILQLLRGLEQSGNLSKLICDNPMMQTITLSMGTFSIDMITMLSPHNLKRLLSTEWTEVKGENTLKRVSADLRKYNTVSIPTFEEVCSRLDTSWFKTPDGTITKNYIAITNEDDFNKWFETFKQINFDTISFDMESTGVRFFECDGAEYEQSKIICFTVSWELNQGVMVRFIRGNDILMDAHKVLEKFIPFINTKKVVTAMGTIDVRAVLCYGQNLKVTYDTGIESFNLDTRVSKDKNALKHMTREYFNHNTWELSDILSFKSSSAFNAELIKFLDDDTLMCYACADTDYTLQAHNVQLDEIVRLKRDAYFTECELYPILTRMEYHGLKIDIETLNTLNEIYTKDIEKVKSIIYEYIKLKCYENEAEKLLTRLNKGKTKPTREQINAVFKDSNFQQAMSIMLSNVSSSKKYIEKGTGDLKELNLLSITDLKHIFLNILKYPVVRLNDRGNISFNSEALEDYQRFKLITPLKVMKEDVLSHNIILGDKISKNDTILVSAKKFNSLQYPFAYLLEVYRKISKLKESVITKLLNENVGGKYYPTYSMTSAETARLTSHIQTIEKTCKKIFISPGDEWYTLLFDMKQIEFRVMVGLADVYWKRLIALTTSDIQRKELLKSDLTPTIQRMNLWWTDYHREGGSIFIGSKPSTMTSEQRSDVKSVHFSVPFGSDAFSLAEDAMKSVKSQLAKSDILFKAEITLDKWRKGLFALYYFLEYVRDCAVKPCKREELPLLLQREFDKGYNFGMVKSMTGRVRYFNLTDITNREENTIRRMVGNMPIQSLARDIFIKLIKRIWMTCKKRGYICEDMSKDKIRICDLVHDEAKLHIHQSIHPYEVYDIVLSSLFDVKGFPKLFLGLSFVDNWYEGKDDKLEAPWLFAEQKAKEFRDGKVKENPWNARDIKQEIFNQIHEYISEQFCVELETFQKTKQDPYLINPKDFLLNYENYFYTTRASIYAEVIRKDEYCSCEDISKSDYSFFTYLDYYLYKCRFKDFNLYKTLWNGEEVYLHEMLDNDKVNKVFGNLVDDTLDTFDDTSLLDEDLTDLDLFDLSTDIEEIYDGDLDELSEKESEISDREHSASKYFDELYMSDSAYTVPVYLNNKEPEDENIEIMYTSNVKNRIFETDEKYIVDVSHLTREQFNTVVTRLRKYIVNQGVPLYFKNKMVLTDSGVMLSPSIDKSILNDIYVEENKTGLFL